jgi:YD repeat-containing protein
MINMVYPDGETVKYGYDHGGQLVSAANNTAKTKKEE